MTAENSKVASLDAARKAARETAARKAGVGKQAVSVESKIRMQVWFALAAIVIAYLAYSFLFGVAHS
jgi:hypothetical protein